MTNIPIYRGKRIDSDKYVEGFLNKAEHIYYDDDKNDETAYYIMKNMTTEFEDRSYFDFYGFKEIDPSTLSIHFPDMLDSQGNKIFASLSDDGKGGDIMRYDEYYGIAKYSDSRFVVEYENVEECLSEENFEVVGIQQ